MADSWLVKKFEAGVEAPGGLPQQADTAYAAPGDDSPSASSSWLVDQFDRDRPAWLTGGQAGSIENGWDTPFYQKFLGDYSKALDDGTAGDYWDRSDATGIVMQDVDTNHRFGDVYDNGKKTGNVYTTYDRQTADQIMGRLTLGSKMGRATTPEELSEMVQRQRQDDNKQAGAVESAGKFESDVDDQQKAWDDTNVDEVLTVGGGAAGGAATGAGIGATIGALFGGAPAAPGAAIGAAIGGLIGGVGAWLNRDEIQEQAARATVKSRYAHRDLDDMAAAGADVAAWSGVALSALNPVSNLTKGLLDDERGDGEAAKVNLATQMGAGVIDALGTFASPISATAYLGLTGLNVAGQSLALAADGVTFDEASGRYDNIFRDDDGKSTPWEAAAGITGIGIDAVQMLGARGVLRGAGQLGNKSRLLQGLEDVTTGTKGPAKWLTALRDRKAAETEEVGGRVFRLNERGEATSSRLSPTALAPSEAIGMLTSRVMALRAAAKRGGAVTTDDLYRAAMDLQAGTKVGTTALVNAFAEGSEEAVQAILDPLSHGWNPDGQSIIESYAMGASMGLGMGIGAYMGRAPQTERDLYRANQYRQIMGKPAYDKSAWAKLSEVDKRRELSVPTSVQEIARMANAGVVNELNTELVESVQMLDWKIDAVNNKAAKEQETLNPSLGNNYKITGAASSAVPAHHVTASLTTVVELLENNLTGFNDQIAVIEAAGDAAKTQRARDIAEAAGDIVARVHALRDAYVTAREGGQALGVQRGILRRLNRLLSDAWDMEPHDPSNPLLASSERAVGVLLPRPPWDNPGSFPYLLPQVSIQSTELDNNKFLQVGYGVIQGAAADFDGDEFAHTPRMVIDDDVFLNLRTGMNLIGAVKGQDAADFLGSSEQTRGELAGGGVNILVRPNEESETQAISRHLSVHNTDTRTKSNAEWAISKITSFLRREFAHVPNIAGIAQRYDSNVRAGAENAKSLLLQELLLTENVAALMGDARSNLYNPFFKIDSFVQQTLQWHQSVNAELWERPTETNSPGQLPVQGRTQEVKAPRAATPGQTMSTQTTGANPFRMFQKLHYSEYRSSVIDAMSGGHPIADMIRFYELVNADMTQSTLEQLLAKDVVTAHALHVVTRMADAYSKETGLPKGVALALVANLQIPNVGRDGKYAGGPEFISVAQFALRDGAREAARRDRLVLDAKPELARKYEMYEHTGPGAAFADIFENVPLEELLGPDAGKLALSMTFGQYKQFYMNRDDASRRLLADQLKSQLETIEGQHDLPYTWEDFDANKVSNLSSVVHALLEAGNEQISFDLTRSAKDSVHGTIGRQNRRVHEQLVESLNAINQLLAKFEKTALGQHFGLARGSDGHYDMQTLLRVLDKQPDIARDILGLLPQDLAPAIMRVHKDGRVEAPTWISHMLTAPAEEGAMIYFRHTLLAGLNMLGANPEVTPNGEYPTQDRWLQLVIDLRRDPGKLEQFQHALLTYTDVDELALFVNKNLRGNRPAFVPWVRDAATFDPSQTKGGWSQVLEGTAQREAIAKLRQQVDRWSDSISQQLSNDARDKQMAVKLLQGIDQLDKGAETVFQPQIDRLVAAIENASKRGSLMGPTALKQSVIANGLSWYGEATDKGKSPLPHQYNGTNDVRADLPAWQSGFQQVMSQLTAYDAADIASNPGVLNGDLRIKGDNGERIDWSMPGVKALLELWRDHPEAVPLLQSVLLPSVYEMTADGKLRQEFVAGTSLADLVNGDVDKAILGVSEEGDSHPQKMLYASVFESTARQFGGHAPLQRMASDLVVARTSALDHEATAEEITAMADEALEQVVAVARMAGHVPPDMIADKLSELLLEAHRAKFFKTDSKDEQGIIDAALATSVARGGESTSDAEALDRYESLVKSSQFQFLRSKFSINWNDPDVDSKLRELLGIIKGRADLKRKVPAAWQAIEALQNADVLNNGLPVLSGSEVQQRAMWDKAVGALLALAVTEETSTSGSNMQDLVIPSGKTAHLIRYYDTSFAYLVDEVMDADSVFNKTARALRERGEKGVPGRYGPDDVARKIMQTILDPDKLGPWNPEVARFSIAGQERIDASGAGQQVGRGGISFENEKAMSAATARTYKVPPTSLLTQMTANPADILAWDANSDVQVGSRMMKGALLNGRFFHGARIKYTDSAGAEQELSLLTIKPSTLGRPFLGRNSAGESGYLVLSLDDLQRTVRNALEQVSLAGGSAPTFEMELFTPDSLPAGSEWANNLFFEGAALDNVGDVYDSLNDALWFAPGGLNQAEQKAALEANKKGTRAVRNAERIQRERIAAAEALAPTDFYAMLQEKLAVALDTDLGAFKLNPSFANAVLKNLKMRHVIKGTITLDTGEQQAVMLSADEVIAAQAAGAPLTYDGKPVESAQLDVLSEGELRTLHGDQGRKALRRALRGAPAIGYEDISAYTGHYTVEQVLDALPRGLDIDTDTGLLRQGNVFHTSLGSQSFAVSHQSKPAVAQGEASKYRKMLDLWDRLEQVSHESRMRMPGQEYRERGLRLIKNLRRDTRAFMPEANLRNFGIPATAFQDIPPAQLEAQEQFALGELERAIELEGTRTAWALDFGRTKPGRRASGVIHGVSALQQGSHDSRAEDVAPRDVVIVHLNTATSSRRDEEIREALEKLTNLGTTIVLSTGKANSEDTFMAGVELRKLGYKNALGSRGVWIPADPHTGSQTAAARQGQLAVTRTVSSDSMVAALLDTTNKFTAENAAVLTNAAKKNHREVAVLRDLVPGQNAFIGFNTPTTGAQIAHTNSVILSFFDDAGRVLDAKLDYLMRLSGMNYSSAQQSDEERADLRAALERARDLVTTDPGQGVYAIGRTLRPGDILPRVDAKGQVLLYRHGYDPIPGNKTLQAQLKAPEIEGDKGSAGGGVAIYGSKILDSATTHIGTVLSWLPQPGYGMAVVEMAPLQALANKNVFELNGMKLLTLGDEGTGITTPGEFMPGWDIDMVAGYSDFISKEALFGVVDNAQAAIMGLGLDLRPVLIRALLGTDIDNPSVTAGQKQEKYAELNSVLNTFMRTRGPETWTIGTVDDLIRAMVQSGSVSAELESLLATFGSSADLASVTAWADNPDVSSVDGLITMAALTYLMTPTADPSHILYSSGFARSQGAHVDSLLMPEVFTQMFEFQGAHRDWFFDQMNDRLARMDDGEGNITGYSLLPDWTFRVFNADGTTNMEGRLQFAESHSSGDNPEIAAMAALRRGKSPASSQQSLMAQHALGTYLAHAGTLKKTERFLSGEGVRDHRDIGGILFGADTITAQDENTTRTLTAGEEEALAIHAMAMRAYRTRIRTERWDVTDQELAKFDAAKKALVRSLGLAESRAPLVDFWLRQALGHPSNPRDNEDGSNNGDVSYVEAMDALASMQTKVENGFLPTLDTIVPTMHIHDLLEIYRAYSKNQSAPAFRLRTKMSDAGPKALTWDEWVQVALGVGDVHPNYYDPFFAAGNDGFFNTYRDMDSTLFGLPVTRDPQKLSKLLDPETAELVISFDPTKNVTIKDGPLYDPATMTFEQLFGGQRRSGTYFGNYPPAGWFAKRKAEIAAHRAKNHIAAPVTNRWDDMRAGGAALTGSGTFHANFLETTVQLSAGMRLFNPWLWASAPLDSFVRGSLEDAANLLTGYSASRLAQGVAAVTGGRSSAITADQMARVRAVSKGAGARAEFKSMIHNDLYFLQAGAGGGRFSRGVQRFARAAAKPQDATYGMKESTIAERYLVAIIRSADQLRLPLSVDQIIKNFNDDPTWFQRNQPDLHSDAEAMLANVKSLKATVGSLLLRSVIEPASRNPRLAVSVPSTLMLKLPMMFQNFWFNISTNLLGLQGLNAVLAVAAQGDTPGKTRWTGRLQAAIAGEQYDPEKHGVDFIAETLESVNIADAFIRSGLTHSALMALGLISGGLGLSGEDDDDKKRRRAAKLSGAAYLYDPRSVENDFRNKDAVYFQNLPSWIPGARWLKEYFQVSTEEDPGGEVSMANLHWVLKQFISPMVGIERFLSSGDIREVVWGFQDAIGSMPLANLLDWDDANAIAAELYMSSQDKEQLGNPEDLPKAYAGMVQFVATYERLLFENSFVNSLYTGNDTYDRDPWVMVNRDAQGNILRDSLQVPARTEALQKYVDDMGTPDDPSDDVLRQGYMSNGWFGSTARSLTENRATLALFSSLFTGFDQSDYLRTNMAAKVRGFDKPTLTEDAATELVMSVFAGEGGGEAVTTEGAEAVFRGLWKQSVQLGDPSLEGVYISREMRETIQEKLMAEIIQDGVDLGLSDYQAKQRMNRLWYGNSANPDVPALKDILWSKEIPYSTQNRYYQLNTTYVIGPDGRPWATGVGRDKLNNFWGLAPLQRYNTGAGNMGVDSALNSTDQVGNINTGLRSLQRIDESWEIPSDEEIAKSIEDAINRVTDAVYRTSNGGTRGYGNSGYGRRGYGSGGGYSSKYYGPDWYRVNAPERSQVPYGNNIPNPSTSNPYVRRASIRRERFSSQRGRLNQWQ